MSNVISVKVDPSAFYGDVQKLLAGSTVLADLKALPKLEWPESVTPPRIFETMGALSHAIGAVVSAVEIVKQNMKKEQGADHFDSQLALETAVKLLDDVVVFEGWLGCLVEKVDGPFLNILVSMYVNGKKANWLSEAYAILGLVA